MEFPLAIIMQWMADFLLPLTRISAMLMVMVGIGVRTVPTRIKAALAVMVTLVVIPVLPPAEFTNLFSFEMVLVVLQQTLIGVAMGFASVLMLNTFVMAGQLLAMQSGLGFATMIDPTNGQNVPAVGQFYLILATLLFWTYDGHLIMVKMLVLSFTTIPIDGNWWHVANFREVAVWGGWLFATALVLSLAPLTAMLITSISFGVMTRAAPQLNIFSIGFPFTLMMGLIIIWATMGNFVVQFDFQWHKMLELMCKLTACSP
ncbi:flagellar biosynthetic protein FliR [Pseudoalteromonas tunicata]|uniref:Flagellar biosynthetic protein FliR n=1 Tax=Pseudoalteromonas tunicata D2 TaxID=87626 RepID=A4C6C2_9GAMM|nr:flagellar biosynthetic protein FliR [Pseudoalteromonas tunicata]ATC95501.1 flagellar biosynthetic protein FliR [Pseudoalteromonas tunicata]AXT31075.1 flagellar type III secretion system protein FliR [Pseudoalteromonas tunicata]EAR29526.1 flagellar biosynthesis protein [Pseudoalteromonas tunicata D2]MDP4982544.1 flagellar biosynthetic protein FliR [Pseudoalteromonas tunicata]MDP5212430.1 flagellar biosynthetic protein FliR [Pseudoalteromonas tunicata]